MSPHFGDAHRQLLLTSGGDERDRTADPLLARQVLSQLSYTPSWLFVPSVRIRRLSSLTLVRLPCSLKQKLAASATGGARFCFLEKTSTILSHSFV